METNENVKELNEKIENLNDINIAETVENASKTSNDNIDMQATQRIVLLGDFFQNEGKKISEENNIEISKKIENFKSDINTESNAQAEQSSQSESNAQITPNEEVNETVNEVDIIIDNSTENKDVAIEETKIENNDEAQIQENNKTEGQKEENAVKAEIQESQTDATKEVQITEKKEDSEEDLAKKKKQHAQDKKDYRLEKMLFDRIETMQGKIKESLELIKKFERINAKEENLPNIVTTLHDKLTHEVIKQFRTVGIEFNMKSFLVQSVVSDLLGRFEEGITEFKDCSENLNFVREVQEDFESRVELAPTSKVKNIFAKIRGIFKPERKQERLEELERERQEKKLQEANVHLIKYKYINGELEKYTIKNNIVGSLAREMLYGANICPTYTVDGFIDEKIVNEMTKLGLDSRIPELKDKIYNDYKEKDDTIIQADFEQMQMGVVKKNMRLQKSDVAKSKITQIVNVTNRIEKEDEGREAI
ncbi:MAG: hypothetical protein IKN09_04815 [Clostridia bacterium]|nr:hypothetical protein [Clostridia bacterium]